MTEHNIPEIMGFALASSVIAFSIGLRCGILWEQSSRYWETRPRHGRRIEQMAVETEMFRTALREIVDDGLYSASPSDIAAAALKGAYQKPRRFDVA